MTATAVAPTAAVTLSDALNFILTSASNEDLSRVIDGIKSRRTILQTINAASVSIGASVKLDGLTPKYLNGLTGTVASINGRSATIKLDERSTKELRWSGRKRFFIAGDATEYPLGGIPLSTLSIVS
jgi:hypothetical protein